MWWWQPYQHARLVCVCVCACPSSLNSLTEKSKGPAVLYTQEHNFNFNSVPLLSTWYGDDNQPPCPPFYCTAKSITLPRSPRLSCHFPATQEAGETGRDIDEWIIWMKDASLSIIIISFNKPSIVFLIRHWTTYEPSLTHLMMHNVTCLILNLSSYCSLSQSFFSF